MTLIFQGDWTEGAYLSDAAGLIEKMCIAVNANDTKALQKCIDEGADVNSRDGLGRFI